MAKSTYSTGRKVATGVLNAPFDLLKIMFGTAQGMSLQKIFIGNFLSLFIALGFLWNPTTYHITSWAKDLALRENWTEEIWRGFLLYPERYPLEGWSLIFIGGLVAVFIAAHLTMSIRNVGMGGKVIIALVFFPIYMGLGVAGIIDIGAGNSMKWLLVIGVPLVTAVSLTWTVHKRRRHGTSNVEVTDTPDE